MQEDLGSIPGSGDLWERNGSHSMGRTEDLVGYSSCWSEESVLTHQLIFYCFDVALYFKASSYSYSLWESIERWMSVTLCTIEEKTGQIQQAFPNDGGFSYSLSCPVSRTCCTWRGGFSESEGLCWCDAVVWRLWCFFFQNGIFSEGINMCTYIFINNIYNIYICLHIISLSAGFTAKLHGFGFMLSQYASLRLVELLVFQG